MRSSGRKSAHYSSDQIRADSHPLLQAPTNGAHRVTRHTCKSPSGNFFRQILQKALRTSGRFALFTSDIDSKKMWTGVVFPKATCFQAIVALTLQLLLW